jgi:hypothetical protein
VFVQRAASSWGCFSIALIWFWINAMDGIFSLVVEFLSV